MIIVATSCSSDECFQDTELVRQGEDRAEIPFKQPGSEDCHLRPCIVGNLDRLQSEKDHTFNNLKQKVNGVVTTIIPFKIIILLFFMAVLPSPFNEPTLPAVSLCHKVC